MGKINLHIANSNEYFTDSDCSMIKRSVEDVESFISDKFNLFDYNVDVIISTPSFIVPTIIEDGISGRIFHSRLIMISIDKNQHQVSQDFLFETLCHEMSHSLRWEKLNEYTETMFDSMILEGLVVVLEEEALKNAKRKNGQFFLEKLQKTSQSEINAIIAKLRESFENKFYNYDQIFFTGNDDLPRWAGYKLGYYFVKQYLAKNSLTIEDATFASYKDFASELLFN